MKKSFLFAIAMACVTLESQAQMRDTESSTNVTVGGELMYARKKHCRKCRQFKRSHHIGCCS
jgi:hypothetical protein